MRLGFLHQPNDPYTIVRMKYFISKGHTVFSITFPKKNIKPRGINGITNIQLPDIMLNRIYMLKRVAFIWHIYKITKELKLEIFHVVNAESVILAAFSSSKKTVMENQGSDVLRTPNQYPWLKIIYKIFYNYVDAVIQDSKIAQEAGLKYGAPKENNEVIEIGIDFTIFNKYVKKGVARKKLNLNQNIPFVFSSRGMKEIYNIDIIMKSIPKVKNIFPDVKIVFSSNYGNLSEDIKQFVNSNNLKNNIIWTGWLNHELEMPYYYCDADVVVSIPSSDSSPFSVYEAIATKTPVIVSDLPWLKGKFIPGKHLISVPIRDEIALSDEIIRILKGDSVIDLKEAYNIVFDKINVVKENDKLEKLYNKIIDNRK